MKQTDISLEDLTRIIRTASKFTEMKKNIRNNVRRSGKEENILTLLLKDSFTDMKIIFLISEIYWNIIKFMNLISFQDCKMQIMRKV